MKKLVTLLAIVFLTFSSLAYAGGDQVCGDKAEGPAGDTGGGTVVQTRPPAD